MGGFVRLKPSELKKLSPAVDPINSDVYNKIPEYALNCALGNNLKISSNN